jgi:Cu/Ag efflux protein CusF
MTCGRTVSPGGRSTTRRCARLPVFGRGTPEGFPSTPSARGLLTVLFAVLVVLFAAGLWGTVIRPAAYEVQGQVVSRAAPDLLIVRHEAIAGLRMNAMETMAITVTPEQLAPLRLEPGDRVRLAVRPRGDDLVLVWIKRR